MRLLLTSLFVSRPHAKDPLLRPLLVRGALPFAKPRSLRMSRETARRISRPEWRWGRGPPPHPEELIPVGLIPPPLPLTRASPQRRGRGRGVARSRPPP